MVRAWTLPVFAAPSAPARLWIGSTDTAMPVGAARLLARSIPACEVTELAKEPHFWAAERYREALEWAVAAERGWRETLVRSSR
jgi:hypothetical protein